MSLIWRELLSLQANNRILETVLHGLGKMIGLSRYMFFIEKQIKFKISFLLPETKYLKSKLKEAWRANFNTIKVLNS
jgi:hypothetical protein